MAKVGGVSLSELNRLEVSFLKRLDFSLHIAPENFEQFCCEICRLDAQIMMEEISARLPTAAAAVAEANQSNQSPARFAKKADKRGGFVRNCSTENMDVVVAHPPQAIF